MIEVIRSGNGIEFQLNGRSHLPNGPAKVWGMGRWAWNLFGERHRYYGPQCMDDSWYIHGELIKW